MRTSFLFMLILLFPLTSCVVEDDDMRRVRIKGFVKDIISDDPISDVSITIDIHSPTGGFSLFGGSGRTKTIRGIKTDKNGKFDTQVNVFDDTNLLQFFFWSPSSSIITESRYVSMSDSFNLKDLEFKLYPLTEIKVHFRNINPVSEDDYFSFSSRALDRYGFLGYPNTFENCGTVTPVGEDYSNWIGEEVCGSLTYFTIPHVYTTIVWRVTKNNVSTVFKDSIQARKGILNEFFIEY